MMARLHELKVSLVPCVTDKNGQSDKALRHPNTGLKDVCRSSFTVRCPLVPAPAP